MRRRRSAVVHRWTAEQLGFRWLALDESEQRRRVAGFFSTLCEYVGAAGGSFLLRPREPQALASVARLPGAVVVDDAVEGPFSADVASWALAHGVSELVITSKDDDMRLVVRDGWNGAAVWLRPPHVEAVERLTAPHVLSAERDGAGRPGRAMALLLTVYGSGATALAAGVAAVDLGPGLLGAAAGVTVGVLTYTVLWPARAAARRWYGAGP